MSSTHTPRYTRRRRLPLQITANNLIKRVKRAAFGFTRFTHYRIRSLLYARRPNWERLATITPR